MLSSLLILLLLPLVGAVIIGLLPNSKPQFIRNIAIVISTITLFYAICLITLGDVTPTDHGLWQSYHHTWNTRLGTSFSLGVDGFHTPWSC